MSSDDPRSLTIQQLKSAITELGYSEELPTTAVSKEEYIVIYQRVSKKRPASDAMDPSTKRPKFQDDGEFMEDHVSHGSPAKSNGLDVPADAGAGDLRDSSNSPSSPVQPTQPQDRSSAVDTEVECADTAPNEGRHSALRHSRQERMPAVNTEAKHADTAANDEGRQSTSRRSRQGRRQPSEGLSLGPVPSGLVFAPRKVHSQADRNAKAFRSVVRNVVWLILCLVLHRWFCPFFCDSEDILNSAADSGCTPCPEYGFCVVGTLRSCNAPYHVGDFDCIADKDWKPLTRWMSWRRWLCFFFVICQPLLVALTVAVLLKWFMYDTSPKGDDHVAAGMAQEILELLGRRPGQAFLPDNLKADLAIKYPDYDVGRLWPKVQMGVEAHSRLYRPVAGSSRATHWALGSSLNQD